MLSVGTADTISSHAIKPCSNASGGKLSKYIPPFVSHRAMNTGKPTDQYKSATSNASDLNGCPWYTSSRTLYGVNSDRVTSHAIATHIVIPIAMERSARFPLISAGAATELSSCGVAVSASGSDRG